VLVLDMIEILPPLGKYKCGILRILRLKCYIDNSMLLQSYIRNINTHQSPLQQSLDDLQLGLQPMEVSLNHTILPVGMGDGTATQKCGERGISVVPQ
jgi:hypothetical protein